MPEQAHIQHFITQYGLERILSAPMIAQLRLVSLAAQQTVLSQADDSDHIYWLVQGQVQVNYGLPDGKLAVLALLEPLALLGDLELFQPIAIQTNIVTHAPSLLLRLAKGVVEAHGATHPAFLRHVIEQLASKMLLTSRLQTTQGQSLSQRLAHYLLQHKAQGVFIGKKSDLAALLGVTPRHLNRVLTQMQADGWLRWQAPQLLILNRPALMQHVGL